MNVMTMVKAKPATGLSTDAARWAAVERRDRAADGRFFYSVDTTGVYCRPSCAARRPKRENVRFHDSCIAAERAGFRPCKRCRPNEAAADTSHRQAIAKACRLIEASESAPDLGALAKAAGMSRFHFHRVFKAATGVTPRAYAAARRAERLRDALPRSATVTEAIYDAGFNSSGRFYAAAASVLGMKPKEFQAGGTGAAIRFAVGACSLGSILVAATDKGVCAILLGDDPAALLRELQDRFPKAELIGADRAFEQLVAKVVGFVEAPALGLDLPLDVRGTAFQQRVWEMLRKIPAGETASYTEIARRIGRPKAVRAVAQACAANSIAVAIPCHRVVRNDGRLAGYRWGIERKRALLASEAQG
ncbi:MAG TPA: bifunctional DNA-binding transcriptional regulator/O6-methylguanine-DNA methyltransferase Ada [Stellaceae bacterium]|nr:bifunctional DNA-binding transcriptional regulator/O6-methylguanine-DNA methyltransferase Ada [Stellaceae bacterium]